MASALFAWTFISRSRSCNIHTLSIAQSDHHAVRLTIKTARRSQTELRNCFCHWTVPGERHGPAVSRDPPPDTVRLACSPGTTCSTLKEVRFPAACDGKGPFLNFFCGPRPFGHRLAVGARAADAVLEVRGRAVSVSVGLDGNARKLVLFRLFRPQYSSRRSSIGVRTENFAATTAVCRSLDFV